MYAGVPMEVPSWVSVGADALVRAALIAFAMPKSVTTAEPPERRTLSGLMSRWTTPRLVRVGERLGDVAEDADDVGDRERAGSEARAKRFALDERHRVVGEAVPSRRR